ncbi:multimeric flavodoxin WrbA [Clostridium tetanomorphum]|uniref:flavodoxin family protein n=1 Tax=Clostridium tetanomorphum TaxID=1553 RepID=UPI000447903B|nr:flavodoxin family protein [Clostridium tetanomorphum]KAJ49638.1 multimeric flavodoxin WrbA [Clostridium tetanomorphum DSM 665]KAJ52428.1 multimeric flavodoxin WrbA [Clostridium tetanomorphum DSM 665]MBP1864735.1 multimeric flavodoxin WrbA [Clostridium tetanomorphum]NRS83912.1 multimeric flavodoxin WrbA [Clostridium tetanomorphum]SQB93133.1 multimeric flavodoxin WrbA [Clostridium tetanomorphum]
MKILTIIGSPKGKGNTYEVAKKVEEKILKMNKNIEFEYLMLKNTNLETCRGCFQCLEKGESHCPLKDNREQIEAKIKEADSVIFAAPVYVYNVPWIMKNFIDRFAYISHRPRFHGKRAMIIATTGAVGLKVVLSIVTFAVSTWGFNISQRLGVICPPGKILENEKKRLIKTTEKNIIKASKAFYNSLIDTKPEKPGLIKLISFNLQKYAFYGAEKGLADYQYWKNKGWLEKGTEYYYNVKINPFKRALSKAVVKIWYFNIPKPINSKY